MTKEETPKPKIYLFHNSTWGGLYVGVAMAEDGTALGEHASSSESWMVSDLSRKTKVFEAHYPGGYELEYVPRANIEKHEGIQNAFRLEDERLAAEESSRCQSN